MGRPATVFRAGLILIFLLVPMLANAQWVWKDERGQTVVSDEAPPSSVPDSQILHSPSNATSHSAPASTTGANGGDATQGSGKTDAERQLDFEKQQREAAEAAKKAQDQAKAQQQAAQRCASLRANVTTLQSGVRITRVNAQGERYFVDDAQRQAEAANAQNEISQHCK